MPYTFPVFTRTDTNNNLGWTQEVWRVLGTAGSEGTSAVPNGWTVAFSHIDSTPGHEGFVYTVTGPEPYCWLWVEVSFSAVRRGNSLDEGDFTATYLPPPSYRMVEFEWPFTGFQANRLVTGFVWNFGDGSTASGNPVLNRYTQAGEYYVTMTAVDQYGRPVIRGRRIQIGNINPVAHATWADLGEGRFWFNGGTSSDVDGLVVSWEWQFAESSGSLSSTNITTSSATIEHTFETENTHTVRLTVVDNDGGRSQQFVFSVPPGEIGTHASALDRTGALIQALKSGNHTQVKLTRSTLAEAQQRDVISNAIPYAAWVDESQRAHLMVKQSGAFRILRSREDARNFQEIGMAPFSATGYVRGHASGARGITLAIAVEEATKKLWFRRSNDNCVSWSTPVLVTTLSNIKQCHVWQRPDSTVLVIDGPGILFESENMGAAESWVPR